MTLPVDVFAFNHHTVRDDSHPRGRELRTVPRRARRATRSRCRPARSGWGRARPSGRRTPSQAGAGGAVDVPRVRGDQHRVRRLDAHLADGVRVGVRVRLPDAGVVDREELLHDVVHPRPLQQRSRDGGRAVRQRGHPDAALLQLPQAVDDVGMQVQRHEGAEHVIDRRVRVDALDASSQAAQHVGTDLLERGLPPGDGDGEAVAEQAREPRGRQMRWQPHLGEPITHGRQVGERLVDVEQEDTRTAHAHHATSRDRQAHPRAITAGSRASSKGRGR